MLVTTVILFLLFQFASEEEAKDRRRFFAVPIVEYLLGESERCNARRGGEIVEIKPRVGQPKAYIF